MFGEASRMSVLSGDRSPNANVPIVGEDEIALEGERKNSQSSNLTLEQKGLGLILTACIASLGLGSLCCKIMSASKSNYRNTPT